jgi:hypothetical protein
MNFFSKLWKTHGVIKKHWPALLSELQDLTGVTRIVVEEILKIWKKL